MKRAAVVLFLLALLVACPAFAAEKAAPTVSITSPEPGITVATDLVDVTAVYSAPKGAAVALVELLVDGVVVQSISLDPAEASGVLTLTWQASGYLDGKHQVVMRVTDTKDRVAKAALPVDLTRGALDTRPLQITSPSPGASVAGRVSVTVEAADASAVKYVIVLVDNVFKAMSNIHPFTYHWDTSGYLNGFHRLQAKAYLTDGGEARTPVIEVRVDNPSGATSLKQLVAPAAPKPALAAPARASESTLPPAVHTQTATPFGQTVEVNKAEIGAPGTAPYVSPTGDLIQPPTATLAGRAGSETRIDAVTVPEAAEAATTSAPADASVATPPTPVADPVRVPAESAPPAAPASAEAAPAADAQTVAPIQVAALPTPVSAMERAPAESLPEAKTGDLAPAETGDSATAPAEIAVPPAPKPTAIAVATIPQPMVTTAAAKPASAAAPVDKQLAMTPPKPAPTVAAPKQIAMLPPKPVVAKQFEPKPKLTAQPEPSATVYVAQPGDYLYGIAAARGVTPAQLVKANGLRAPYAIRVGQRLTVPDSGIYIGEERVDLFLTVKDPRTGWQGQSVSLRQVVEKVGGTVSWDSEARQARADARGHQVVVTIGDISATVDGKRVGMTVGAVILSGRTLVPARFLGDALDLRVTYARGVTRIAAK